MVQILVQEAGNVDRYVYPVHQGPDIFAGRPEQNKKDCNKMAENQYNAIKKILPVTDIFTNTGGDAFAELKAGFGLTGECDSINSY